MPVSGRSSVAFVWTADERDQLVRWSHARRGWLCGRASCCEVPSRTFNQAERWFGLLTDKLIRRGTHRSVQALEADIRTWIQTRNEDPEPFTWTKSADEILNSPAKYLARISGAGN